MKNFYHPLKQQQKESKIKLSSLLLIIRNPQKQRKKIQKLLVDHLAFVDSSQTRPLNPVLSLLQEITLGHDILRPRSN
jgi:hypothetical protein